MMDIKEYDWNFVYKIRDSGYVVYTVTIPAERKKMQLKYLRENIQMD